ncbi:hypothetical protein [Halobacteriovorax sp. JY17]|uniref:hypothetical protein n=1 Tax=Halobacteriovorax sp. JY17 TaxID=2014617 RepID=UPI000C6AE5C6|nr:hypothetical protein [Halobacteriovorax sp. JY17]PIK15710.1 MAG: hypothetical protein CES88_02990 [Halobacteriovorax sp. JY17]
MKKVFYLTLSLLIVSGCTALTSSQRELASVHDTRNCRDTINNFMSANPTKSGPIITGASSLGNKIPNFENFRSDMLLKRPSIDNFVKRFSVEHPDRKPTNLEVLNFFERASEDLAGHIRSAKGIDERLDFYLELSAAEIELAPSKLQKVAAYKSNAEFTALMKQTYDARTEDSAQIFNSLGWTNYKGHLGELDVLLRLENLQAQGVYLARRELLDPKAQAINDLFSSKLEEKIAEVTLQNIESYKEKYPHIFKVSENMSNEEILKRGKVFLETKEFDLVIKKNNKYSLVEVKNYKNPIGMRDASEGNGHKKTILDQQLETIEILHFLGVENEFFPTVAFLRGVTPEARAVFESKGISVLAEVID